MSRERDWLDTYPEGNSDYGTYREQSKTSIFYPAVERYRIRNKRRGQYLRRLRRLTNRAKYGQGGTTEQGQQQ